MKKVIIYGLRSSGNREIRYIGQTVSSLRVRVSGHIHSIKRANTPVAKWIKREIEYGNKIESFTIIDNAVLHKTEKWVIRIYRWAGERLLNITDGGEGTIGFSHHGRKRPDLAERNRQRTGLIGHKWSDEDKKKQSLNHKGKKCPWNIERNKNNLYWLGRKHTEEEKKKIGLAHIGKIVSYETREKIRQKALDRHRKVRDEQTTLFI